MGFEMRKAGPQDAALVLQFMQKLGAFQNMADQITATEARLARLLERGLGEAVFGLRAGVPVGFMYFSETSSAFSGRSGLFLDAFFIEDSLRGQGLGKAMMAHLAQIALARGGEMLEWGCMDWNAAAIGFYQAMGAYCLDEMRIYRLGPDDVHRAAGNLGPV